MVTVITFAANPQLHALLAVTGVRPAFNGAFYATTAAVIPVLYLALTVQGPMLPSLLARLHKALDTMRQPKSQSRAWPWKLVAAILAAYATMTVAIAILGFGALGEIVSLLALAHRHSSAETATIALWSATFLLLLTAAGPVWTLNTFWVRLQWIPLRTAWQMLRNTRPAAEPEQSIAAASAGPDVQDPQPPPSGGGDHDPPPGNRTDT